MKVALVYDRVNKWGGAERVLLALHKIFPQASLYTSLFDKENAKWAKEFDVKTSFLQGARALRQYNDFLALFMPIAFESFKFDQFDLVISVTSEAAKGIITKPKTTHICYCLTPTRYLWSGYDEYFSNEVTRFLSSGAVSYLKSWDKVAASRPDYFIAISREVQTRIRSYYGRESEIIYPPIMLERNKKTSKKRNNRYFLLVSRFSRFSYYKKVELAIQAFNKSALPLKVVGSGPLLDYFKNQSNANIEFLGQLTDEKLRYYYENCEALIFPGLEDFGLVMTEAQFFGAPVIAYRAGGAIEIIKEGVSGEFFNEQTPDSLTQALKRFDGKRYNKLDIIRNSQRFSYIEFKKQMEKFVKDKL